MSQERPSQQQPMDEPAQQPPQQPMVQQGQQPMVQQGQQPPQQPMVQQGQPIIVQPVIFVSPPIFEDPKYLCCCGCMHVRTGSIVVGVITSILWLGELERVVNAHKYDSAAYTSSTWAKFVIAAIFLAILFIGIFAENTVLLWIYVIGDGTAIIIYTITGLYFGITFLQSSDETVKRHGKLTISSSVIFFCMCVWFMWIIYRLIGFYNDKKRIMAATKTTGYHEMIDPFQH